MAHEESMRRRVRAPYLAWLSMRSGGCVTPSAAASLPVNSKSLCRDS